MSASPWRAAQRRAGRATAPRVDLIEVPGARAGPADTLMLRVVQVCQTMVSPAIWCPIIKVEIGGHLLLVVDVPASSPGRPYRADHVFYIRDASMTREATRDEHRADAPVAERLP